MRAIEVDAYTLILRYTRPPACQP